MARILIADDDADYLRVFQEGMEALGHEVEGVPSGSEVVPMLENAKFDVIFLDVVMAGGGAITVLHAVREYDPDIPVAIITGRLELADSPLFLNGLRLAQAKLQKTATLAELDNVVRMLTRH
ncbi:response regulator [Amaricoccus tamworthensis]|uniref:response regulator n=1 Tax=Amaricoccus tamworthensis TaxID=57002 RepID=UPI003C7DD9C9